MSLAWWVGGYFRWCSSGQIFNGWRYGAAKYQDQVLMKGCVLPYCFTHRTYMPLFRSWCIVTFSMVANNWIIWNWAVWQGVANLKGLTESSKPSLLWAIWGGPIERYNHGMWNVLDISLHNAPSDRPREWSPDGIQFRFLACTQWTTVLVELLHICQRPPLSVQ